MCKYTDNKEELKYLRNEKYQEYFDKYGEKALKYIKSYLETYGMYPDSELVEEAINDKKVKKMYIKEDKNGWDYVYLQLEDGSFYEDSLIEGYVEY